MNTHITSINDITAIVATHERQEPLQKMVSSFREFYPQLEIVAVDSSEKPNHIQDIKHILTREETGISNKRNIAIQEVKTSLFLLLDDDYICTDQTDIEKLMSEVINNNYNIMGGNVNNIGSEQYNFHGYYDIIGDTLYHFVDKKDPISDRYDVIFNFFVGRTDDIKSTGWDKNLKFAREHDDFFLKLKKDGLSVGYNKDVIVDHENHIKHHGGAKSENCVKYFFSKWDIKNKVEVRLIDKKDNSKYISYRNFIVNEQHIKKNIENTIQSMYGNYPIIISGNE